MDNENKLFEWLLMNYLCWKCKCLSDERYESLSEIDDWRQHVAKEMRLPKSDWLKQNMSIKDVFSFVAECYPHNLEQITDMLKHGLRNK
jgi:hypothetical protein